MTNSDTYYDDLDIPCSSSFTAADRNIDPKTVDDYAEFIKMGSQIKLNLVKHTKEENTIFLLRVLRSIISEQALADLLDADIGDIIYQSVKEEALKRLK